MFLLYLILSLLSIGSWFHFCSLPSFFFTFFFFISASGDFSQRNSKISLENLFFECLFFWVLPSSVFKSLVVFLLASSVFQICASFSFSWTKLTIFFLGSLEKCRSVSRKKSLKKYLWFFFLFLFQKKTLFLFCVIKIVLQLHLFHARSSNILKFSVSSTSNFEKYLVSFFSISSSVQMKPSKGSWFSLRFLFTSSSWFVLFFVSSLYVYSLCCYSSWIALVFFSLVSPCFFSSFDSLCFLSFSSFALSCLFILFDVSPVCFSFVTHFFECPFSVKKQFLITFVYSFLQALFFSISFFVPSFSFCFSILFLRTRKTDLFFGKKKTLAVQEFIFWISVIFSQKLLLQQTQFCPDLF